MKPRAILIALCLACSLPAAPLDVARHAKATRLRENLGGRDGLHGERGPYQLKAITWRQHMGKLSFDLARDPAMAEVCAVAHIRWLMKSLKARGVPATCFNTAGAWNAGLDAYTTGKAHWSAYRYAADVERLYSAP